MVDLKWYVSILSLLFSAIGQGQITFVPNVNQWAKEILFQSDINSGRAFFTGNGVTFSYYNSNEVNRIHAQLEHEIDSIAPVKSESDTVHCFAFGVTFIGGTADSIFGKERCNYNRNYFSGNDPSHWAGDVPVFNKLYYEDLYPGIDAVYYGMKSELKYDFVVRPGADPAQITLQYEGLISLALENNELRLDLGFMNVKEMIPSAYQYDHGIRHEVKCRLLLDGNRVHFVFPEGYNKQLELIIDPEVIASTFSGGTSVTRGYCSTYDEEGNIYAAGTSYGTGFPVTLGAYDVNYASAGDIVISKYNPDGSALLYCTYLGGSGEEYAHSMIVTNGNLYVYGSTFSFDFPVTAQAYSQILNGICDIYVSCLNVSGSILIGSTLIGGSWSDGVSMIQAYRSDSRRGEIIIAANGDVLIASGTLSQDFPATAGAFDPTANGGQDAIVFRMNATLSNLIWATFIGSGVHDMAFGVREGNDGTVYVCGAANNMFSPFPVVQGCYQSTPLGATDAFVAKFSGNGSTLLACTFYGGTGRDIAYFLDLDKDGDVYIFGEATGEVPVTPGVYSVTGSRNFIAKFDLSLTSLLFSTVVGSGTTSNYNVGGGPTSSPPSSDPHVGIRIPRVAIVPAAFGVDECERIYFCGFGSSQYWPLTDDALYQYSGANQCYIGVLEENATALLCATMYGGWHIDGGMGRFDDHGVLYQTTCQDENYFPTTAWAFSDGSVAAAWDVCVFKIDMYSDLLDEIVLPNVFTPNNDGINDRYISGYVTTNYYEIEIFDRYGIKVYNSADLSQGWDGMYNGKECEEGVYFCTLRYNYCTEIREKTGFLHLQR